MAPAYRTVTFSRMLNYKALARSNPEPSRIVRFHASLVDTGSIFRVTIQSEALHQVGQDTRPIDESFLQIASTRRVSKPFEHGDYITKVVVVDSPAQRIRVDCCKLTVVQTAQKVGSGPCPGAVVAACGEQALDGLRTGVIDEGGEKLRGVHAERLTHKSR